jgi:hydroxypyruvate reductase
VVDANANVLRRIYGAAIAAARAVRSAGHQSYPSKQGVDAARFLAAHGTYGFFAALGDRRVTGSALTNVNDIRAILIR